MVGQNVSTLMPEPDRSRHDQYMSDYLHTGEGKIIGKGREVLGQRKDGTTFPLRLSVSEVRLGDRVMFTGMLHDLTEFKRMQEEVVHARNLATIGEMAATVAHEFRNPLAGISGAIQVLRDTFPDDDSRRQVVEDILEQVERLDSSVRQLLMLSKPWRPSREPCDLRKFVERLTDAAQGQQAFAGVRFVFRGGETVVVAVDTSLLEQVLWNILHNAAQAMPGGGEIHYSFDQEPDYITLAVADTGCGIPDRLQERLFRPFFTTKTRGTGLGLAICRKIMQSHHGSITVSSKPEKGTEVTLRFPKRT